MLLLNKTALLISCSSALLLSCSREKPNLLIIHTDEHNFRTLGCYRETLPEDLAFIWGKGVAVETPHIDWLAENGVICTSFYATTPVCSPSRATFLTGRYPQHTPVVTNNIPLDDSMITFAQILQENGYATGYAGKWHLDGIGKPQWEPERKFGFADNRYMFNRGHYKQLEDTENGPRVATRNARGIPDYQIKGADSISFTTDFLTRKTIEFIKEHKASPFCFMVSYPDPHGPNTVRSPYDTIYNHLPFQKPQTAFKSDEDLPQWGKKAKRIVGNPAMAKYFGMVHCLDDNVGKLIECLRDEGVLENTIIVFTSDHGDLCGEHHLDNKNRPYEASVKVPFIVYYPGKIQAGLRIDEALSTVDFQSSMLSLMDQPLSEKEEGRNATHLFTGDITPPDWNDVVFLRGTSSEAGLSNLWVAAVTDRFKLILSECEEDEPWLYDLEKDPDELINYYKDPAYEETVSKLSTSLLQYGVTFEDQRVLHPNVLMHLKY